MNRRLQALDRELRAYLTQFKQSFAETPDTTFDRAFLFTIEAYAATILQRLRAELFERRYEMPKSDADVFAILQRNGVLDLVEGRKLRQFCESRHLSARDLTKIDREGLFSALGEVLDETRVVLTRLNSAV